MNLKQNKLALIRIECGIMAIFTIAALLMHGHEKYSRIGEIILVGAFLSATILTVVILLEETFGGYTLSSSTRKNLPKFPPAIAILGLIAYIL